MSNVGDKFCLIVGQMPDPHIDALVAELEALGEQVLILDSFPDESLPTCVSYSFSDTHGGRFTLRYGDKTVDGKDAKAVFWRVKAPLRGLSPSNPDASDYDFRFKEWERFIAGLSSAFPNARWVNAYGPHALAGNKLRQLQIATEIGLRIPRTVVSNVAEDIRPLFDDGEVIYKTLSHPFYTDRKIILTTKISQEFLRKIQTPLHHLRAFFRPTSRNPSR